MYKSNKTLKNLIFVIINDVYLFEHQRKLGMHSDFSTVVKILLYEKSKYIHTSLYPCLLGKA